MQVLKASSVDLIIDYVLYVRKIIISNPSFGKNKLHSMASNNFFDIIFLLSSLSLLLMFLDDWKHFKQKSWEDVMKKIPFLTAAFSTSDLLSQGKYNHARLKKNFVRLIMLECLVLSQCHCVYFHAFFENLFPAEMA